jgi:hypothetical protein
MSIYFEFVGSQAAQPLVKLDAKKIPRLVQDGAAAASSFPAATEAEIWSGFSAHSGRFKVGPGPMNVRAILKWNDDGDHLVHVWAFPRYIWSS